MGGNCKSIRKGRTGIRHKSVLCTLYLQEGKRQKSCITPLRPTPRNLTAATVGYNWRMAKLTCTDPRAHIYETLSFYDKTSGETYGFNSDLSRLTALKGRITLQENRIKDYIEANKGNLFFDETNDPQLVKVRRKLERARKNVADAEARLRTKVEQKIAVK